MTVKTSYYSMLGVTATIDGLAVDGWWDGDETIKVEQGADVGGLLVGANGDSIFSQSADRSARITIQLQHTSAAHRQLMQKWVLQRSGGGKNGFPFSFIDRNANEGGSADRCYVQAAPTDGKGKNATMREWVLITGDYEPEIPNG